ILLSLRSLDRRSGWLGRVELTSDQRAELAAAVSSADVSASVATRARIVLWRAEGRPKVEIAALAGVSRPTVDLWLSRFPPVALPACWTGGAVHRGSRCLRSSGVGCWR